MIIFGSSVITVKQTEKMLFLFSQLLYIEAGATARANATNNAPSRANNNDRETITSGMFKNLNLIDRTTLYTAPTLHPSVTSMPNKSTSIQARQHTKNSSVKALVDCNDEGLIKRFPRELFTRTQRRHGAIALHVLLCMMLFIAITIVIHSFLLAAIKSLCDAHNIRHYSVRNVLIAAGTLMPMFFVNIISVFKGAGDLGSSTVIGSCAVNLLMFGLFGLMIRYPIRTKFARKGPIEKYSIKLRWFPVWRDNIFYIILVCLLLWTTYDHRIKSSQCIMIVLLYLPYIFIIKNNRLIEREITRCYWNLKGIEEEETEQLLKERGLTGSQKQLERRVGKRKSSRNQIIMPKIEPTIREVEEPSVVMKSTSTNYNKVNNKSNNGSGVSETKIQKESNQLVSKRSSDKDKTVPSKLNNYVVAVDVTDAENDEKSLIDFMACSVEPGEVMIRTSSIRSTSRPSIRTSVSQSPHDIESAQLETEESSNDEGEDIFEIDTCVDTTDEDTEYEYIDDDDIPGNITLEDLHIPNAMKSREQLELEEDHRYRLAVRHTRCNSQNLGSQSELFLSHDSMLNYTDSPPTNDSLGVNRNKRSHPISFTHGVDHQHHHHHHHPDHHHHGESNSDDIDHNLLGDYGSPGGGYQSADETKTDHANQQLCKKIIDQDDDDRGYHSERAYPQWLNHEKSAYDSMTAKRYGTISASHNQPILSGSSYQNRQILKVSRTVKKKKIKGSFYFTRDLCDYVDGRRSPFAMPDKWHEKILWVFTLPIVWVLYLTIPDCRTINWRRNYFWSMCACFVWLAILSYALVWMSVTITTTFEIPESIMGFFFLSFGLSISEVLTTLLASSYGDTKTISCVYTRNIFNISINLGLVWFIKNLAHSPYIITRDTIIYANLCQIIVAVAPLFLMLTHWRMNKKLAVVYLCLYFSFVCLIVLFEYNVIGNWKQKGC